jgi:hypothetical protein
MFVRVSGSSRSNFGSEDRMGPKYISLDGFSQDTFVLSPDWPLAEVPKVYKVEIIEKIRCGWLDIASKQRPDISSKCSDGVHLEFCEQFHRLYPAIWLQS